jgi:hypothetical protein
LKRVKFRTWQTENVARIIDERINSIEPGCRLQITTNAGYGDDRPSSKARGYGGAETKYAITEIKGWREEVSCKLYPILLIRYAGAI